MFRPTLLASLTFFLLPTMGWANPPKVVVDIAPLHSIVAQVMDGVARPDLLVQPEASPHSYSLRPMEAKALSQADVVFWISHELTPWMENSLNSLAGSAEKIEMLDLSATIQLEYREGATFEAHDHGAEDHHREHEHEHEHEHRSAHEDHHDHGDYDPHAWLDPKNAKVWADEIAKVLSKTDPKNATTYQQNARSFGQTLDDLMASLEQRAQRLDGIRFLVFHDAYQYFEHRFGLYAAGAIALSDATDPSPARIREIQKVVSDLGINCVFTEPQYNPRMIKTVFEGAELRSVGVMDPLGVDIGVGKDLYSELLERLMGSLETCLP